MSDSLKRFGVRVSHCQRGGSELDALWAQHERQSALIRTHTFPHMLNAPPKDREGSSDPRRGRERPIVIKTLIIPVP